MSEGRFLKVIIVCLLLVNIGTLGFLLLRHPPHHGPGGGRPRPENAGQYLRRELNLSDEQENKFRSLREAHHEQVEGVRERMATFRKELYRAMKESGTDTTQVTKWIDSLSNAQRQIELITYSHFSQVRAICNPDQQKKFDEVITLALGRLNSPQQGPPSPREGR